MVVEPFRFRHIQSLGQYSLLTSSEGGRSSWMACTSLRRKKEDMTGEVLILLLRVELPEATAWSRSLYLGATPWVMGGGGWTVECTTILQTRARQEVI